MSPGGWVFRFSPSYVCPAMSPVFNHYRGQGLPKIRGIAMLKAGLRVNSGVPAFSLLPVPSVHLPTSESFPPLQHLVTPQNVFNCQVSDLYPTALEDNWNAN